MSAEPELNAIEEAAAAWMIERDRGLTAGRERELERWLRADARHTAAFEALDETWKLIAERRPAVAVETVRQPRKNTWWQPALAAAAAIAVGVFAWSKWTGSTADPAEPFALSAATEIGRLHKVELPDGSVIQLNTDSAVDVRFDAASRRVRLARGEAHFTVARNGGRPFIVSAGGVDVRVVGTIFNVRLRTESVDVLVTEGKVRVGSPTSRALAAAPSAQDAAPASSELTAGQKVSIALAAATAPAAPIAASPAEIRQMLAWQDRRLDFDGAPLSEIVAEINRYSRHKLMLADPRLNAERFGGSFPASDHEAFVRMLEADFGVVAERKGGETWLRRRAP